MVGVGKLLKEAQKIQKKMEEVQASVAATEIDVSSGGGAVQIKVSGNGIIKSIKFDDEFLKEDKAFVEETILAAVQEALTKARAYSEEKMGAVTSGFSVPGLM